MILHEIFREVSRFPRYISCYIAEIRIAFITVYYCTWNIPCIITFSPIHSMLYRGMSHQISGRAMPAQLQWATKTPGELCQHNSNEPPNLRKSHVNTTPMSHQISGRAMPTQLQWATISPEEPCQHNSNDPPYFRNSHQISGRAMPTQLQWATKPPGEPWYPLSNEQPQYLRKSHFHELSHLNTNVV